MLYRVPVEKLIEIRQNVQIDERDVFVPLEMFDAWHSVKFQFAGLVKSPEPDRVFSVNLTIFHLDDRFVVVEISELAALPRRDDVVVRPTDQHHVF